MKFSNKSIVSITLLTTFLMMTVGCEREISDEAVLSSFGTTAEVFTDDFIGLGADFYFPFADAKPDVFSVDITEGFESNSSIRIDVPNATDPTGSYAGAIFRVQGAGRDLTQYDALTLYVKASQGVELGDVGYGIDYLGDKYQASISGVNVGTGWSKVIIPIPDASKLLEERGVFWFAAGTQSTGGSGYTLWFDEIKFEKTGTVGTPRATIFDGQDINSQAFVGSTIPITGLQTVFNLTNGQDVMVATAPSYFGFNSSDTSVASVNDLGVVSVKGNGSADITATLAGNQAQGKLTLGSSGALPASPIPTQPQANVLSLFSDAYTSAVGINFDPRFGGSTTSTTEVQTGNGKVLEYKTNNYTGIMFDDNPLDGAGMQFLHIDVYVQNAGGSIGIQIRDIGANKTLETDVNTGNPIGDDKDYRETIRGFTAGAWKSFDIPLAGGIATQKGNLGALIITGGPDFIFDNLYFFKN
ncbi:glycosyl hydrolase family 16 [Bacteroidia bacterium]|nr:glycosyl hydrolase family 16 [Bacteroidia bacterium]